MWIVYSSVLSCKEKNHVLLHLLLMPSSFSVCSVLLFACAPLKIPISCFIQFLTCFFSPVNHNYLPGPFPELVGVLPNKFRILFLTEKEVSSFPDGFRTATWVWLASRNNTKHSLPPSQHPSVLLLPYRAPELGALQLITPQALTTTTAQAVHETTTMTN